jgi:hypothetical protein
LEFRPEAGLVGELLLLLGLSFGTFTTSCPSGQIRDHSSRTSNSLSTLMRARFKESLARRAAR